MFMAKGGARARSGPPPDPDALTFNEGEWTVLPAAGRRGPAPGWPLSVLPDELEFLADREAELWVSEWARPQAVMWERQGQELEVALYVRSMVAAEMPGATVAARTLVRQQMEALGISIPGLLRNRWKIETSSTVSKPKESRKGRQSVRDRLTVVDGGG